MIKPANDQTVLDGRGSIGIRALADYPVIIESGSSYKSALAIYGYNGSQTGNRGKVIDMQADGKITSNSTFTCGGLIKTTRNTGYYGVEVKPDNAENCRLHQHSW